MRSSRGTSIRVVAKGVNVHAALGIGVMARDVPCYGRLSAFGGLLEGDGALDVRVTTEDGDCCSRQKSRVSTGALVELR